MKYLTLSIILLCSVPGLARASDLEELAACLRLERNDPVAYLRFCRGKGNTLDYDVYRAEQQRQEQIEQQKKQLRILEEMEFKLDMLRRRR